MARACCHWVYVAKSSFLPFEGGPRTIVEGQRPKNGWNFLANEPVSVFSLRFGDALNVEPGVELPRGPCLPILELDSDLFYGYKHKSVWLVLDERDDLKDMVYRSFEPMSTDETGHILPRAFEPPPIDDGLERSCYDPCSEVYPNWTSYFKEMVDMTINP
ncbi:hypothetical protein C8J56DRAFT_1096665 [Mycena floridula]|nr:hypothetical protein C8J56DRAFT_1096665 [Mycena floridula]